MYSFPAQDLITRLLHKDPAQRLGGGARDGHEVQEHEWFAPLDFDKLYRREIPAPFVPKVRAVLQWWKGLPFVLSPPPK